MGFDVVTMDGDVDRSTARAVVNDRCGLQGSYNPAELVEENGKTAETVKETAKAYLEALGPQKLIANLGEGLGGKESPELVQVFIDTIHSHSEEMIKAGANE
jgi:uroporphyrinogen decarboxylase